MPKISKEKREEVICLLKRGNTLRQIASIIKCHHSTVSNIKNKFSKTGSVEDLVKTGRPRKSTPGDDRKLIRESLKNRFLSAKTVRLEVNMENQVSLRPVQRRLNEFGLHCRTAIKKPMVSPKNRQARRKWALQYSLWDSKNGEELLFRMKANSVELTHPQKDLFDEKLVKEMPHTQQFLPFKVVVGRSLYGVL